MKAGNRAKNFIKGEKVDQIPFHPLVMQWASKQAGVPYGKYCTDHVSQVNAMGYCIENLGLEWVHPSGFAYCEAEAYGLNVIYPENNLPFNKGHLIKDFDQDISKIKHLHIEHHKGMMNRVEAVSLYRERYGDDIFICGHMEGPLAEYTDLRGVDHGFMDLMMGDERTIEAIQVIVNNAKNWAKLQIEAGADCMSIGDAVCSQIGPDLYESNIWPFHKELVSYMHSLGAMVKYHICGDISTLIPMMIETGVDIIDVDHLVNMGDFVGQLRDGQVMCGNLDPVDIIRNSNPEKIYEKALEILQQSKGKVILSGGCEIPIDTPVENLKALTQAARDFL